MASAVRKIWGYRYFVLLIVWLLYVVNYFDRIAVLTFLPFIQQDLNLTPAEVGQLASTFFFAYALGQVSAGFLADKFGPKKIMNIAIIVFTAITALTGFIKTFTQFFILRIGLGIGEAHHFAPAAKTITNWFPRAERGKAMSWFTTSNFVAPAIVPLVITSISVYWFGGDWRPVFFLLCIPGIIGVLLLWYFITDTPKEMLNKGRLSKEEYQLIEEHEEEASPIDTPKKKNYGLFLKDVNFYIYMVIMFCNIGIYWGSTTWLSSFLVKQHGLDLKQMGLFASAPYIVAAFSTLFGGWLMDKFGHMKPVALIAYLGCIPVLWALGSVPKGNTVMLLTFLLLTGFFISLNAGCVYAYVQKRYPREVVGGATGLSNGFGQFGAFISPLVAGYLVHVSPDGVQDFSKVFAFFASLAGIAAIGSFLLKEKPMAYNEENKLMEPKQTTIHKA
ncbi:MFS transporter [Brevibacillus sp. AY1]|uniref:MFS transporter n=1 Tax=Brevibacillus sp. AY1 TaxID=2807621 RepID=UPI002453D697|nr:MFS transporter [Brevibacillus sp. AY1]MDH4619240.1 MFS transporter [Brevibacillus sp. AY1]